jgi:hypothetical protein
MIRKTKNPGKGIAMRSVIYPLCSLVLLTLLVILTDFPSRADIGPKPSMDFKLDYEISEEGLVDGKLLLCEDENCSTFVVFQGPFFCDANGCNSYALWGEAEEYVEYHKLVLTFQDGVRESNVFTKRAHSAKYTVIVRQDGLEVAENHFAAIFSPYLLLCFSGALFSTLSIEVVTAYVYLRLTKIKLRMLAWVALANCISLTIIWIPFAQQIETVEVVFIVIAETFALLFEAAVLFVFGRKLGLTALQAFVLSLLMNTASFTVGYLGWYLLSRP